ncbi:GIY-YIG nuclease family protein [Peribacillus simplex]|uniref:GIY-YIG nuclease family protein n=1 Tax=Peribacillus simplex TaxID=1478 RepID=UPI00203A426F|nr:GIY-YIG nuclease family protein [Peribacillus simplex]MCM3675031.1 GIY-YIG nuclease family protein [Peribacillus simplex]
MGEKIEPKSREELTESYDKKEMYNSLKNLEHDDGDDSSGICVELFKPKPPLEAPSLINTQFQGIKTILKGISVDDNKMLGEYAGQQGCYIFLDNAGKAVYVGESDDIYQRIRTHLMGSDPSRTTHEVKIEWFENPEYDEKKNPKKDKDGNFIFKTFKENPYKYFWTVDIYCLSGLDTFFARKYLEQLLFYTEQPIHNQYTETKKSYKDKDILRPISLAYIDFLQNNKKNPEIQTIYIPTLKTLEKDEII